MSRSNVGIGYGVKPVHYRTVAKALLWTLEQGLKDDFTPEVKKAWTVVYTLLADTIVAAADQDDTTAESPKDTPPKAKSGESREKESEESREQE